MYKNGKIRAAQFALAALNAVFGRNSFNLFKFAYRQNLFGAERYKFLSSLLNLL